MKKSFLAICTVMALTSASIFANVETDINYYVKPWNNFTTELNDVKTEHSVPSMVGFENNWAFFFGNKKSILDVGLGIGYGIDIFSNPTYKISGQNAITQQGIGLDYFFKIGPIFRLGLGRGISLSVTPGLVGNLNVLWPDLQSVIDNARNPSPSSTSELTFAANLAFFTEAAVKIWFFNSTSNGFHFGLNAGAQVEWPIIGAYTTTGSGKWATIKDGFDVKFFAGLCFNFGSRGIDRYKETE